MAERQHTVPVVHCRCTCTCANSSVWCACVCHGHRESCMLLCLWYLLTCSLCTCVLLFSLHLSCKFSLPYLSHGCVTILGQFKCLLRREMATVYVALPLCPRFFSFFLLFIVHYYRFFRYKIQKRASVTLFFANKSCPLSSTCTSRVSEDYSTSLSLRCTCFFFLLILKCPLNSHTLHIIHIYFLVRSYAA